MHPQVPDQSDWADARVSLSALCVADGNGWEGTPKNTQIRSESWTQWVDSDNAGGSNYGDSEELVFSSLAICGDYEAVEAQCQTTGGLVWNETGLNFSLPCGPRGIVCLDVDNSAACPDFRVRYKCGGQCVASCPQHHRTEHPTSCWSLITPQN